MSPLSILGCCCYLLIIVRGFHIDVVREDALQFQGENVSGHAFRICKDSH